MITDVTPEQLTPAQREALVDGARCELARRNLLDFIRYCWWMPQALAIGRHTQAICERIDRAIESFERGESTFLDIGVPFRHGKSDIVSRALPAYFLGRFAAMQPDVILSGYGADLVEGFSRKAKTIIEGEAYQRVFPEIHLSKDKNSAASWAIDGSAGEVTACGLGGAITGKGGALIVIDDYCKKREEAESSTYRKRVWESFKDDLMTRRAPVAIVIVCATRWHVDDLSGRIKREMAESGDFPRFESISFPAQSRDYPSGTLFPERFDAAWYASQRATLGAYSAAALLDNSPVARGGNMLKVDQIKRAKAMPEGVLWVRIWDLASTEAERTGDDPDWTWGTLLGVKELDGAPWLYIADCKYIRAEAPERNKLIVRTAKEDGPGVWQGVESVAGYKDTVTILADILKGLSSVHAVTASKDKVVCMAEVEPVFEAGHVVVKDDVPWYDMLYQQLAEFPNGAHDDGSDTVSKGFKLALERYGEARGAGRPNAAPRYSMGGFT